MDLESPPRDQAEGPGPSGLTRLLRSDVEALAVKIGERNLRCQASFRRLQLARDFIAGRLSGVGRGPAFQRCEAGGRFVDNVEVELGGVERADELVIIGAHYDSAPWSPGANDNGTGVAALLALAHGLAGARDFRPGRTLRFVAFAVEEPPFIGTREMGSMAYARRCHDRGERVVAMLSLETLGYYFRGRRGAEAPFPLDVFSPVEGSFVAVVGNLASKELVPRVAGTLRDGAPVRCLGVALPGLLPLVKSSDHWSFWQHGFPAVMVTDTGPLRYKHYHHPSDTLDKIDFATFTEVVRGLMRVGRELTGRRQRAGFRASAARR